LNRLMTDAMGKEIDCLLEARPLSPQG
jgi:hypothetical protein